MQRTARRFAEASSAATSRVTCIQKINPCAHAHWRYCAAAVIMAARGGLESSDDSDFELPPPSARRRTTSASSRVLSLSRSLRQRDQSQVESPNMASSSESASTTGSSGLPRMTTAARRLNQVVRHGLSVVNSRRNAAVATELATSFPFLSQSSQRNRLSALTGGQARNSRSAATRRWKATPCLLNSPNLTRVPTRDQMDQLCRKGLGTLWFDKDDQLQLPHYYNSEELHFVLLCLYPQLVGKKYELCRVGGPSHHLILPLPIDNPEMIPSRESPFRPYFTVDLLKERIGRKGRLYIRPLTPIELNSCPTITAEEVTNQYIITLMWHLANIACNLYLI